MFITPGGIFGSNGNGYVRLSLCQPVEVLAEALERVKTAVITRRHDEVFCFWLLSKSHPTLEAASALHTNA